MERVSFDIERQEVADALREQVAANGRTMEQEAAAVVAKGVAAQGAFLVDRLIAICGDDSEMYLPARDVMETESVFFNHDFS